jgi:hypothetical protein
VSAILSPGRIALLITLVGGLLRLYRYTALSLWFDEGGTIWFARLPWANVLGMGPTYDTHPPGYNVLIKLLSLVVPELIAGRLLSVVAGTLTIPVLYALARRLLPAPAALVASGVLAFAPVHLWYSQEARQYALMTLLVACSYLALVAFHQTLARRWAVAYALATLAAIYCEYSAVYALAGQVVIFAYLTRVHRRRALPIWIAAGAVVVGFLPWLPQLTGTLGRMGQERAAELGVSPEQIRAVLLSLTGVGGYGRYYLGSETTPWESWPALQGVFVAGLLVAAALGVVALLRQPALAKLAVGALALGTLLVGIVVSLAWPGFAERTTLPAVLGWALLVGAAVTLPLPRPVRLARYAGVAFVLFLAAATLATLYRAADKEHWRALAAAAAQAAETGKPIATYHPFTSTLINLYEPGTLPDEQTSRIEQGGPLPAFARPGAQAADALWLASVDLPGIDQVREELTVRGYQQLLHNTYGAPPQQWHTLALDLYAQPGARLGTEVPVNGAFAGSGTQITNWSLPPAGAQLLPGTGGHRELVFTNGGEGELGITTTAPGQPGRLYLLSFEARSQLQAGRVRSFLICTTGGSGWTLVAPNGDGATVPNDGAWHTVMIPAQCPATSASLILDLRNAGAGVTTFRNVRLQDVEIIK